MEKQRKKLEKLLKGSEDYVIFTNNGMGIVGEKGKIMALIASGLTVMQHDGTLTKKEIEKICELATMSKVEILNETKKLLEKLLNKLS